MALVMAEQLKRAGFKPDLQVVDWATLVQRRNDSSLWDIYVTHSGLLPEPMLSPPQLGEGAPGWWSTPAKQAALQEFNHITVPAKRGAGWAKVQQAVYDEVPYMNLGKFSSLACGAFATAGGLSAFAVALLLEHAVEELNFHRRAVPGPASGFGPSDCLALERGSQSLSEPGIANRTDVVAGPRGGRCRV
jgi:hypothetical protein